MKKIEIKTKLYPTNDELSNWLEIEVVVIDTTPTGHTLLLLDSTLSYHWEVQRTKGETPLSVQNLLPRLRDSEGELLYGT